MSKLTSDNKPTSAKDVYNNMVKFEESNCIDTPYKLTSMD